MSITIEHISKIMKQKALDKLDEVYQRISKRILKEDKSPTDEEDEELEYSKVPVKQVSSDGLENVSRVEGNGSSDEEEKDDVDVLNYPPASEYDKNPIGEDAVDMAHAKGKSIEQKDVLIVQKKENKLLNTNSPSTLKASLSSEISSIKKLIKDARQSGDMNSIPSLEQKLSDTRNKRRMQESINETQKIELPLNTKVINHDELERKAHNDVENAKAQYGINSVHHKAALIAQRKILDVKESITEAQVDLHSLGLHDKVIHAKHGVGQVVKVTSKPQVYVKFNSGTIQYHKGNSHELTESVISKIVEDISEIRKKNPTQTVHDVGTKVIMKRTSLNPKKEGETDAVGTVNKVEDHGAGMIAHYVRWPKKRKDTMHWGSWLKPVSSESIDEEHEQHEVVNKSGTVVGTYSTRNRALHAADKKDLEYGAIAHHVRPKKVKESIDESATHYHSIWVKDKSDSSHDGGKWMHHFDADNALDAADEARSQRNSGYKAKIIRVHKDKADWRKPEHVASAQFKLKEEELEENLLRNHSKESGITTIDYNHPETRQNISLHTLKQGNELHRIFHDTDTNIIHYTHNGKMTKQLPVHKAMLQILGKEHFIKEEVLDEDNRDTPPIHVRSLYVHEYAKHGGTAAKINIAKEKGYAAVEKKYGKEMSDKLKVFHDKNYNESLDEEQMPLKDHPYHQKTNNELRYVVKDASEAAKAVQGHDTKAESKYLDQVNDASSILGYRKRVGLDGPVKESINEAWEPHQKHVNQHEDQLHVFKQPKADLYKLHYKPNMIGAQDIIKHTATKESLAQHIQLFKGDQAMGSLYHGDKPMEESLYEDLTWLGKFYDHLENKGHNTESIDHKDALVHWRNGEKPLEAAEKYLKSKNESLSEHITQENGKWVLRSKKTGKHLGTFDTREQAVKREGQIEYFKHQ
jgi:hypothetical protein